MDKLKEERNWTGRKDSRLVKNLLIKRRHDYAPKRVQTLIQLRQTTTLIIIIIIVKYFYFKRSISTNRIKKSYENEKIAILF